MRGEKVLKAFLFDITEEPKSIYSFSPVYKVEQGNKSYIVKKTQSPIEKAMRIVNFVERLHKLGVPIVTPVPMRVDNPQQVDETVWVVYPFIEGKAYTGEDKEIYEAGKLLGHIHSLSSSNNDHDLGIYDEFDFEKKELTEDLETIKGYTEKRGITLDDEDIKREMQNVIEQQDALKALELPSVATPNDYKANNLIYNGNAEPYLIDPDNAVFYQESLIWRLHYYFFTMKWIPHQNVYLILSNGPCLKRDIFSLLSLQTLKENIGKMF